MGYDSLVKRIGNRRAVFDVCVDARFTMQEKLKALGVRCITVDELLPDYNDSTGNNNHAPDEIIASRLSPDDVVLTRDVEFIETILGKDRSIHVPQQAKVVSRRLGGRWVVTTGVRRSLKIELQKLFASGVINELYFLGMQRVLGRVCSICDTGISGSKHEFDRHMYKEHGLGYRKKPIEGFFYP